MSNPASHPANRNQAISTCHLCEANCGIVVEHDSERVLAVRGDVDDPFSKGHICPKAAALADLHHDPDRLRRPLVRSRAGTFGETSWDEALDLAADRLAAIRAEHGNDAIAIYLGNPTAHSHGALLYSLALARLLGTHSLFSSNSVDAWPRLLCSYLMYGSQAFLPVPDIDRTSYLWILGANPAVSNGSVMTAPGIKKRITAVRERGGRVVVFDPRHTETARLADEHHFIRPESDALFLAAVLSVLFAEKRTRPGRLVEHLRDRGQLAELARLVAPFTPERVATAVGIPAEEIIRLARAFAAAPSATCYGRLGTCTQEFGTLSSWLIDCLNIVTGNFDRAGGAMFARAPIDLPRLAKRIGQSGGFGRWRSRVGGHAEVGGELPAVALAEEIETPGPGRVRALISHAGNPVLSLPNGNRLERALGSLDFFVAIDIYRNETTRHADLILPPTFGLERDHYPLLFGALSVRNVAKYNRAVFARPPGMLHDWEILHGLSRRLMARRGFLGALGSRLLDRTLGAGPEAFLRLALRFGSYRLPLARLLDSPHGIDLGPLVPRIPEGLPGDAIELVPRPLAADCDRLAAALDRSVASHAITGPGASLTLISRRQLGSNNSWMHNSPRLVKGRDRCTLLMHPDDAGARGISAGDRATITSRTGSLDAPVEISAEMMPGTVSLPHGWGHHGSGIKLGHATAHPGVSVNQVTCDDAVDALSGCVRFAVRVDVRRASAGDSPSTPATARDQAGSSAGLAG